jgi:hypothetical protein
MQIATEFGYWEKKPALILKAKVPRSGNKDKRYVIKLDEVWIYSEDHYEQIRPDMPKTYESFMMHKCLDLYELFDLGTPDARQLAEVAWLIEDAIDSLINMPPQGEMERMVKAEDIKASLKIDGEPVGH